MECKSIKEIDACSVVHGVPNGKEVPLNADVICSDVHGSLPPESTAVKDDLKEL